MIKRILLALLLSLTSLYALSSIEDLERRAKTDGEAAYNLGLYYAAERNNDKAFYWFKKGYELGDKQAATGVGYIYDEIYHDYPNAIKWYEIAYKMGDDEAAYDLGILYEDIRKDYPNAIKWYEIAHKEGHQGGGLRFRANVLQRVKRLPQRYQMV